ncbi:hypothetical protein SH203_03009 [Brevundimonas sp. SH203]|nr:hypothetical protein SH203_03009 [Brevundimonas sp. SH203]
MAISPLAWRTRSTGWAAIIAMPPADEKVRARADSWPAPSAERTETPPRGLAPAFSAPSRNSPPASRSISDQGAMKRPSTK